MGKEDSQQSNPQASSVIDSIVNSPVIVLQKRKSSWSEAWEDFKRAAEAAEADKNDENAASDKAEHV